VGKGVCVEMEVLENRAQNTISFGSGTYGTCEMSGRGNWLRSLFAEILHHDYVLENDKVIRERMAMMLVVDNKPIYDHAHGEGVVVKDKRLAIDMLLARRDLKAANTVLRWVDTRHMLSDALTIPN